MVSIKFNAGRSLIFLRLFHLIEAKEWDGAFGADMNLLNLRSHLERSFWEQDASSIRKRKSPYFKLHM